VKELKVKYIKDLSCSRYYTLISHICKKDLGRKVRTWSKVIPQTVSYFHIIVIFISRCMTQDKELSLKAANYCHNHYRSQYCRNKFMWRGIESIDIAPQPLSSSSPSYSAGVSSSSSMSSWAADTGNFTAHVYLPYACSLVTCNVIKISTKPQTSFIAGETGNPTFVLQQL